MFKKHEDLLVSMFLYSVTRSGNNGYLCSICSFTHHYLTIHSSPYQNGPAEFFNGSKLPLPEEKHDEELYSTHDTPKKEQFDSDSDSDMLDFPEVPKVSVQPNANFATAPDMVIPPAAMPHPKVDLHSSSHSGEFPDMKQEHVESTVHIDEPHTSFDKVESKQFLPFISPPSESYYARHSDSPPFVSTAKSISPPSESPASYGVRHSNLPPLSTAKSISPPSEPSASFTATRHSDSAPSLSTAKYEDKDFSLSTAKSEANLDLQDVVAAAHAAAETAERAAAAARSAASLAQLRISELTKMRSNEHILEDSSENPFYAGGNNESTTERDHFIEQNAAGNSDGNVFKNHDIHHNHYDSERSHSSSFPSFYTIKEDFDSSLPTGHVSDDKSISHHPKRLPSMEDDPYESYPNLFTSQNSNVGSHTHSDNSRTPYDM